VVAWAGGSGGSAGGARRIFAAAGSLHRAPVHGRAVITVSRQNGIDELGLAPAPRGATAAWAESWFDRRDNYHSVLRLADFGRRAGRAITFSTRATIVSGIAFAGDSRGDQLLSWKTCTWTAVCAVRAAVRPAGGHFGRSMRLGSIDVTETPAVAMASRGQGLVGWISGGHVFAAQARSRFSTAHLVSSTTFATDLALRSGAGGTALATWSEGTFAPSVVGALWSSR
jgi:hypothetical protein